MGRRLDEHRQGLSEHTFRYNITKLVYLESHETAPRVIEREKQIKKWRREKKIALIDSANPEWLDLSNEILWLGELKRLPGHAAYRGEKISPLRLAARGFGRDDGIC